MLDWLIVGGGPQGRVVARALCAAAPDADVQVLDPGAALDVWTRRADACGMTYLRSPGAHHLGQHPGDLRRFAAARGFDNRHWLGYYRRPSRALFEAHAARTLTGPECIADQAFMIAPAGPGWRVDTHRAGCLRARRVVVATGPNRPFRPAPVAAAEHVYDAEFDAASITPGDRVAVVGGGLTGAQLALRLKAGGAAVHWVTRRRPQSADFDSDPCYAGRKCLAPFARAPLSRRAELLAAARRPGSLTPNVMAQITAARAAHEIAWHRGEPAALDGAGLTLAGARRLRLDRVVLATGFERHARPDSLLGAVIERLGLTTDRNGHVVIDDRLQAAPGLHLIGRPASLRLGPMAGNIRGAHLAANRLAALIGC